ncbi:MAG: hypothetical protein RMY29_011670 [Nostoc sp. CreGUA01]
MRLAVGYRPPGSPVAYGGKPAYSAGSPRRASALGRQRVGRVSRLEATAVGSADLFALGVPEG